MGTGKAGATRRPEKALTSGPRLKRGTVSAATVHQRLLAPEEACAAGANARRGFVELRQGGRCGRAAAETRRHAGIEEAVRESMEAAMGSLQSKIEAARHGQRRASGRIGAAPLRPLRPDSAVPVSVLCPCSSVVCMQLSGWSEST